MSESSENAATSSRTLRRLIGLSGGVLTLLGAAYFSFMQLNYVNLYAGLSAPDAALIVEELQRQEKRYRLTDGGSTIQVPSHDLASTRLAIAGADAPQKKMVGFEIFNESSMGLTDFAQKIKYQRALQGELARTLVMVEGVINARVHIAMQERALFRGSSAEPKAAVTLITQPGLFDAASKVEGIQRVVAASVPDLTLENVVVLNERGEILSVQTGIVDAPMVYEPAGDNSMLVQYQQHAETLIADALGDTLDFTLLVDMAPQSNGPASDIGNQQNDTPDRSYTLVYNLTTDDVVSSDAQEQIRQALVQSGRYTPELGDQIAFERRPAPKTVSSSPAPSFQRTATKTLELTRETPPVATAASHSAISIKREYWAVVGITVVSLILLAALGLRRRLNRTDLTPQEQEEFAGHLRQQLLSYQEVRHGTA